MPSRPSYRARSADLVVEHVGADVLVYDQRADVAHCLTAVAATAWLRCQGGAELEDLVGAVTGAAGDPELAVLAALAELSEKNLLEIGEHAAPADDATYNRRGAAVRAIKVGAAASTAPLIFSSVIRPAAAMATPAGCRSTPCDGDFTTADNICKAAPGCSSSSFCTGGTLVNGGLGVLGGHCQYNASTP